MKTVVILLPPLQYADFPVSKLEKLSNSERIFSVWGELESRHKSSSEKKRLVWPHDNAVQNVRTLNDTSHLKQSLLNGRMF